MTYRRSGTSLVALGLSALVTTSPAVAQEGPGREGRLSYGTGLNYDFNDGLSSSTDVALSFVTRTPLDSFAFGFGTQLYGDFTDGGSDDFEFRNWFADLDYQRRVADSAIAFSLGYRETQLDDEVDTSGPVIIINDDGSSAVTSASLRYETGLEGGPFGLSVDLSYRDRSYTGTTDPDLTDSTTTSADVLARFAISPSSALRLRAGITHTDEEVGTDTETTYVGVGASTETGNGLTVTGDILFDRSEGTTTEDGLGIDLNVTQQRPYGSVSGTLASRIDEAGRRTTLRVGRSVGTPTGELSYSLGLVDQEGQSGLEVIGDVSYSMATPRGGDFTVRAARDAGTDDTDTVISTSLRLAYSEPINAVSRWDASLGYFATDELGGDEDSRTTATLGYTRDLTSEWSLNTGYEYSRDEDGEDENAVFFNITRDITFGF